MLQWKKKFLLFIDKQGQKPLAKLTKQEKTKINSVSDDKMDIARDTH
jgi:hypothetical protein